MRNITSHNSLKTTKSTAIESAVDFTGLPKEHITLLFESDNLDGFLELYGFKGNTVKNELPKSFNITEEIKKILDSTELEKVKLEELTRLTTYASGLKKLDSIDVLNGISELLIITDKKAKDYILGINKIHDVGVSTLFESEDLSKINLQFYPQETKMLFESIQTLLTKQNRRWGNNYRMDNTYDGIMSYLKADVEKIMLQNELTSTDTNIHMDIIKSYINNKYNPLYVNFSTLREILPDVQTLVLDLSLLIEHFVMTNSDALEFTKASTLFDYRRNSNELAKLISSSIYSSKIVNKTLVNSLSNNSVVTEDKFTYNEDTPLITLLANNIDFDKIRGYNYRLNINSECAKMMLNLISSASVEFNLKLRPSIKAYVTKALELVNSIDVCNYKLKQFKN